MTEQLPQELQAALQRAAHNNVISIAYSGGLDSRFLSFAAQKAGYNVHLLHVVGPHIAPEETEYAKEAAARLGLDVTVIHINPLNVQALSAAGKNRCYVCKSAVFTELKKHAAGGVLCDGTNASDALVFRPGAKALRELGIHSPLAEAGLTKDAIRALGRKIGFENPEQVARPCLLTRFPYGAMPDAPRLKLVADAERFIAGHPLAQGLRFRLRFPKPETPQLHIERASLALSEEELSDLVSAVKSRFPQLSAMQVQLLDKLSGFYDKN